MIFFFLFPFGDYCNQDKAIPSFGIQEIKIGSPFLAGFLNASNPVLKWSFNEEAGTAQFTLEGSIAVGKKGLSFSDIPTVPASHDDVKMTLTVKSGGSAYFAKRVT